VGKLITNALRGFWMPLNGPGSGAQRRRCRTRHRHLNDVGKLALEYRRQFQTLPELIGARLNSIWVRQRYPLFCKSVGIHWEPPAYKDFAKKLAQLMPRKRRETWREGRRVDTGTWYTIPDPTASVVEFAGAQRKRA
jgi:hypothetical protein